MLENQISRSENTEVCYLASLEEMQAECWIVQEPYMLNWQEFILSKSILNSWLIEPTLVILNRKALQMMLKISDEHLEIIQEKYTHWSIVI